MPEQFSYPSLLGDVLSQTAARVPGKEALVFGDERVTWAEVEQRVNRLAKAFLEMGVALGDRIGVIALPRPEYLYVYLAAARIGAIMVGFNIQYTPTELTQLSGITKPVAIVVLDAVGDKQVAGPLKPLFDSFEWVKNYLVIGNDVPESAVSLNVLMREDHSEQNEALKKRKAEVNENDGVLIVFTSGSTGVPKAALMTHKNVIDNIAVETRQFGVVEQDRILLHLPMNHVAGATEVSIPALMTGSTLVFLDRFHPATTLDLIQKEKITFLGQVPTMFIMELNLPNFAEYDLSSLRMVVVAGAATPPPVMKQMMKMAPTVYTGYGMTEVAGFMTYTEADDDAETISYTVGKIAPEFGLKVVDDDREEVPIGEVGEVALKGSCVMKKYFGNPEETAAALDAEGWFYSGDMGRLDERNYLTLVDRKKEMYITGGYNVYPREVEEHISHYPQVAFVAVIGADDEVMGEIGRAFVVPKPGQELASDNILEHCRKGLAEYKIPREIIIRESLPLTALGKVDKMKLRREQG